MIDEEVYDKAGRLDWVGGLLAGIFNDASAFWDMGVGEMVFSGSGRNGIDHR